MLHILRSRLVLPSASLIATANFEFIPSILEQQSTRRYAVAKKVLQQKEDKSFIDLDTEKLCSYVCINYFVEAKEPGPKILPDDQYPSWLFELDLRPRRELEDLDPEVDGWLYWRAYMQREAAQKKRIEKLRYKFLHLQNSPSMRKTQGLSYKDSGPRRR